MELSEAFSGCICSLFANCFESLEKVSVEDFIEACSPWALFSFQSPQELLQYLRLLFETLWF